MAKTIKVSEETWKYLDALRKKGETFDDVIKMLLLIESFVQNLTSMRIGHA